MFDHAAQRTRLAFAVRFPLAGILAVRLAGAGVARRLSEIAFGRVIVPVGRKPAYAFGGGFLFESVVVHGVTGWTSSAPLFLGEPTALDTG